MKPGRSVHVIIPPALVAEIQAAADQEHRPADEVVRDALEAYLETRQWRLRSEQEFGRAREARLPDDEAPLTPQYRQTIHDKITLGLQSLREGKSVDGEIFLAQIETELDDLAPPGCK